MTRYFQPQGRELTAVWGACQSLLVDERQAIPVELLLIAPQEAFQSTAMSAPDHTPMPAQLLAARDLAAGEPLVFLRAARGAGGLAADQIKAGFEAIWTARAAAADRGRTPADQSLSLLMLELGPTWSRKLADAMAEILVPPAEAMVADFDVLPVQLPSRRRLGLEVAVALMIATAATYLVHAIAGSGVSSAEAAPATHDNPHFIAPQKLPTN